MAKGTRVNMSVQMGSWKSGKAMSVVDNDVEKRIIRNCGLISKVAEIEDNTTEGSTEDKVGMQNDFLRTEMKWERTRNP